MKKLKYLVLATFCFGFIQVAQAQKQVDVQLKEDPNLKCDPPIGKDGFSISYNQVTGQKGKTITVPISVRTPEKSNEVYDFNDGTNNPRKLKVDCFPLMKGASIKKITFQEVEVTSPSGSNVNTIKIYTNAKNFEAGPGEKICVKISGVPDVAGKYSFVFKMKAKASLGLSINANCDIENGHVIVK